MEATSPLREAWHVLYRHKRKMTLFFLLVMAATTVYIVLSPRAYRSQAKLLLRLGRENVTLDPTATFGQAPMVVVPQSRENEINSAIEVLKSRPLIEQVVDSVGPRVILGQEPLQETAASPQARDGIVVEEVAKSSGKDSPARSTDREEAIRMVLKVLEVEAVKRSDIILLTYDGSSPELSRAVVSRLTDFYLERHLTLNRTPGAHQFLGDQAARLRAQLSRSEEQLRDLKNETGVTAPEAQRQLLITRIGRLEDELAQAATALSASEAEVRVFKERLVSLPPTQETGRTKGLPNLAADGMRGQLYTLELKEQELLAKHPERHPDVQLTRQQVAAAKLILAREEGEREQVTTGPNRLHEEVQAALLRQEPVVASLRARTAALGGQLAGERDRMKSLNDNHLRIARLQREVELQESDYRKYAGSLEQTQIDRALEQGKISNVHVVQPATCDLKPVRPRVVLTLGLGLVLAMAGAIGLAMLAEKQSRPLDQRGNVDSALPAS